MSQRMTAITIVAPFSKMLNDVRKKVSKPVWFISLTEVIKERQRAPITHPKV